MLFYRTHHADREQCGSAKWGSFEELGPSHKHHKSPGGERRVIVKEDGPDGMKKKVTGHEKD